MLQAGYDLRRAQRREEEWNDAAGTDLELAYGQGQPRLVDARRSRRDILKAAGIGAAAGAFARGETDRRGMTLDTDASAARNNFTDMTRFVRMATNLEPMYPGGFDGLTDGDLEGIFVTRSFYHDDGTPRKRVYELSLPREIDNPFNLSRTPAIEVFTTSFPGRNGAVDLLRMEADLVPVLNTNGDISMALSNKEEARKTSAPMREPGSTLPRTRDLKEEEVLELAIALARDPRLTGGHTEAAAQLSESDTIWSDVREKEVFQSEWDYMEGPFEASMSVEDSGEVAFTFIDRRNLHRNSQVIAAS